MNAKNVEALAAILRDLPADFVSRDFHQRDITVAHLTEDQIATALAARGVLVPSTIDGLEEAQLYYAHTCFRKGRFVEELERIAKGEPS